MCLPGKYDISNINRFILDRQMVAKVVGIASSSDPEVDNVYSCASDDRPKGSKLVIIGTILRVVRYICSC
jgi:hypothetical protein